MGYHSREEGNDLIIVSSEIQESVTTSAVLELANLLSVILSYIMSLPLSLKPLFSALAWKETL